MRRLPLAALAAVLTVSFALVAGCGGSDSASDTAAGTTTATSSGAPITIGYSAWPGWFPLKVAEEKGFFTEEGVNVKLKYFTDYIASIDALSAGTIDANAQTLNDTIASVASGVKERIVLNTDFSAGNDAVIVDKSISSVAGLRGKTVAAEAGVVDHFLLLQGLQANGLTEKDIDFRGSPTDAAAAAFAAGQFDAVAVFAPFTLEALKRPGSKVLFSSKEFPGTISDHLVFSEAVASSRAADLQKIVNAWYKALAYIESSPDDARAIMAKQAGISVDEYASFEAGTALLSAKDALAAFAESDEPTSLPATAKKINPFLVKSGLTKQDADLTDLFVPTFTQEYVDAKG